MTFLGKSGLPKGNLSRIWKLSSIEVPKNKLSKDEFFRACKYIAIKQSGRELEESELAKPAPVPKLGQPEVSSPARPTLQLDSNAGTADSASDAEC